MCRLRRNIYTFSPQEWLLLFFTLKKYYNSAIWFVLISIVAGAIIVSSCTLSVYWRNASLSAGLYIARNNLPIHHPVPAVPQCLTVPLDPRGQESRALPWDLRPPLGPRK